MAQILLVQYGSHSFLQKDQKLLEKEFTCDVFRMRQGPLRFFIDAARFVLWTWTRRAEARVIFTRFADYHAFAAAATARMFGLSFIIVLGGYDAVWIPAINFGVYRKWKSRAAATYAIRHAKLILPVDESLIRGVNCYSDREPRSEGIKEYIKDIPGTIITVYNGYDADFWKPRPGIARREAFLTVANVSTFTEWIRKGIDHFVKLAASMPSFPFIIVGMDRATLSRFLEGSIPENVELQPPVKADRLAELYSSAKVYVQLSLSEGMPNSLCEAMLCECVPVGSDVNGIPKVIGETGFLVHRQDLGEMQKALVSAMDADSGVRARDHIIRNYSLERRQKDLLEIFRQVISV